DDRSRPSRSEAPPGARGLDRRSEKPADRAGDREPALALPFRRGPRRDPERFRRERRTAFPPGAPRLARVRPDRARLEPEAPAPAPPHLENLEAGVGRAARRP